MSNNEMMMKINRFLDSRQQYHSAGVSRKGGVINIGKKIEKLYLTRGIKLYKTNIECLSGIARIWNDDKKENIDIILNNEIDKIHRLLRDEPSKKYWELITSKLDLVLKDVAKLGNKIKEFNSLNEFNLLFEKNFSVINSLDMKNDINIIEILTGDIGEKEVKLLNEKSLVINQDIVNIENLMNDYNVILNYLKIELEYIRASIYKAMENNMVSDDIEYFFKILVNQSRSMYIDLLYSPLGQLYSTLEYVCQTKKKYVSNLTTITKERKVDTEILKFFEKFNIEINERINKEKAIHNIEMEYSKKTLTYKYKYNDEENSNMVISYYNDSLEALYKKTRYLNLLSLNLNSSEITEAKKMKISKSIYSTYENIDNISFISEKIMNTINAFSEHDDRVLNEIAGHFNIPVNSIIGISSNRIKIGNEIYSLNSKTNIVGVLTEIMNWLELLKIYNLKMAVSIIINNDWIKRTHIGRVLELSR